jgi:hypothetical protein
MLGIIFSFLWSLQIFLFCYGKEANPVVYKLVWRENQTKTNSMICLWGLDSVGSYHGTSLDAFFPNSLVVCASHAG